MSDANNRYQCPLDGSSLNPWTDPGWHCPHNHGKGNSHQTLIAYDTHKETVVEQLGGGKVPVLNSGPRNGGTV